jgi:microcystin-dependent protein
MAITRENWLRSVVPAGTVIAFAGATPPSGWLLCDGSAISRSTYSALFEAISTAHGSGDGSTTFTLPDYRGTFLRGRVNVTTITGSGTVPLTPPQLINTATFTNHGLNRTGFKVRLSSGTLSGLAASTDYYAIVVDSNTIAFATTLSNAIAGTRVAISGANGAVIVQHEDPDYASRTASTVGGNSANGLGSVQDDSIQGHWHGVEYAASGAGTASRYNIVALDRAPLTAGATGIDNFTRATDASANGVHGNPRTSIESRPKNVSVNYIIKT